MYKTPLPSGKKTVTASKVLNESRLTPKIWGLWLITGAGFALDGFDLFIIGIAMPLLMKQYTILAQEPLILGLLAAAAPIGAIIGAAVFGRLTDTLGRKFILVLNMILFIIFSILCAVAWDAWSLLVFRFIAGIGIGGEYPVNSAYIAEIIPKKNRKQMQVGNFSFQAVGAILGALTGVIVLELLPQIWTWRLMLGIPAIIAFVLFFFRLSMPESSKWLASQGQAKEASRTLSSLTGDKVKISELKKRAPTKFSDIFSKDYIKLTVLASVPWFLMDIAFYGIGIFTPIILASLFKHSTGDFIAKDIVAIKGALFVDTFLIIGIIMAIVLIKKRGMVSLQIKGFWGMAIGMIILMCTEYISSIPLYYLAIFSGFTIFYLSLNAGPNPMSFLIPTKIYPTELRATGQGFAAAFAKAGATLGIVFLPWMQNTVGVANMALFMAIICIAGALITQLFAHLIIIDKELKKYQNILDGVFTKKQMIKHKL
ncbi:MAG: hypothetical protein A2X47_12745 [Lentisphaerae bacterium GWF2_38_69]|nr:MAG: hypothetical protein A2X47_12745 [Lentisphaerae bacterium GWF2_38_69]